MTLKTKEQFKNEFAGHYCTNAYYRVSTVTPLHVLTDGTKDVADTYGAYWLMDIIGSYAGKSWYKKQNFIVVVVKVNEDSTCVVEFQDGNYNVLYKREIDYTDFPFEEAAFWVQPNGDRWVIFLPSEY